MTRARLQPIRPGDEFGRWVVLEEIPFAGQGRLMRVRCSACGVEKSAFLNNIKSGKTGKIGCACTVRHPRPLGKTCGCGEELTGLDARKLYANESHRCRAQYRRDRDKAAE